MTVSIKKSLDLKLALTLFFILIVMFLVLITLFNRFQTSSVMAISSQITDHLSQVELGEKDEQIVENMTNSIALLKELPQNLKSATFSKMVISSFLVLLIIMGLIGVIFNLLFLNPLKVLTQNLENSIVGDERDLTIRLNMNREDEVGRLSQWVDKFLTNLDEIIINIGRKTGTLAAASSEVFVVSEQMDDESTDLSGRSNSVAAAAEEMNSSMHTVAAASEEASTNISMVSDAAAIMQTNITGVAQNCIKARDISNNAIQNVDTATEKVGHLGDAAKEISNVTQVITDIAEQTNLLALNATIEAARAGEAGKGFAVVASEIKSLASQTADATQSIREKIEGIQNSTDETVHEVGKISVVIAEVDNIVNEIAHAIEDQSDTATEVAKNIEQASIGISEVNENVAQSSQVASEIATDIARVDQVASEMSSRATHMTKGSKDLDGLSQSLRKMISVFRVSKGKLDKTQHTSLTEKDVPDLMPWNSRLETSIQQIDDQHKKLVILINKLHRSMRLQKGSADAGEILNELAEYTVFHFGYEEDLFKKYEYPEKDSHVEIHKTLVNEVVSFQSDFSSGKATLSMDLMDFLTD